LQPGSSLPQKEFRVGRYTGNTVLEREIIRVAIQRI
jgi:hypothetical protein